MLAFVCIAFDACVVHADDSKMTFDDITFGQTYKIKGYAAVTLLGFKFVDAYAQWDDEKASPALYGYYLYEEKSYLRVYPKKLTPADLQSAHGFGGFDNCNFQLSGNDADFAWLKIDIRNLQKEPANFLKDTVVKIIYDDEYEYDGWIRQFNLDYSKSELHKHPKNENIEGLIGWPVCLSPVDEMPIAPMYTGHYAFGCTLPNFIVEDKSAPLRMVITMNGHKLTYNIR